MSGAMWKKEVVIRPNSTITLDAAIQWVETWLESFYTGAKAPRLSKKHRALYFLTAPYGNRHYTDELRGSNQLDDFFADLFDSRTGELYRIYHSACKQSRGLETLVFRLNGGQTKIPAQPIDNGPDSTSEHNNNNKFTGSVVLDAKVVTV